MLITGFNQPVARTSKSRRFNGRISLALSAILPALVIGGLALVPSVFAEAEPAAQAATVAARTTPAGLERAARDGLGRSVQDLGQARFVALDSDYVEVDGAAVDTAQSMYVAFNGSPGRQWKVFLGEWDGPVESTFCETAAMGIVSCEYRETQDGTRVIESILALREFPEAGPGMYTFADATALDELTADELRFEHNVRAIRADGTMTSVTETVTSPPGRSASNVFRSPRSDLEHIALDPSLRLR